MVELAGGAELVDRIYEAAMIPETWPDVLDRIAHSVDAAGGLLAVRNRDTWTQWRVSAPLAEAVGRYLASEASAESQSTPRLLAADHAGFVADHELFEREEYLADPFMVLCGTPIGCDHAAATAIGSPDRDVAVFQVQRIAGADRFTPGDIALLDRLRPHLARAVWLSTQLRMAKLRAAADALELIGMSAAFLDPAGRVVVANATMERRDPDVVWLPGDRITFADRGTSKVFADAVSAFGKTAAFARSFPVCRDGEYRSRMAHLVPVTRDARDLFSRGFALLAITNAQPSAERDGDLVRAMFDLTAAEARVAIALLDGADTATIARRHAVSRETVRSQAKSVFAKAGCHRHVEFMSRFRSLRAMD